MSGRLLVRLPRDRRFAGTLQIEGRPDMLLPCLGKADGQKAAEAGNPTRDPVMPYGDTPTGLYRTAAAIEHLPPHPRMGRWSIPLVGLAGEALAAMQSRTGLAIHGGRGNGPLAPTYGCLRLRDADMEALVAALAGAAVEIAIDETPQGA